MSARSLALLLSFALFLQSCQSAALSVFRTESLPGREALEGGRRAYKGPRYRVLLLEFQNSAEVQEFAVTADADLTNTSAQGEFHLKTNSTKETKKESSTSEKDKSPESNPGPQSSKPKPAPTESDLIENNSKKLAGAARTITETILFQTGRFEVIPIYQYEAALRKYRASGLSNFEARERASQELKIDYILYGDLTDFEIKTTTSYWKVPFWAILLIGSLFIKDRRARETIWYALLRTATIVPLNSALWRAGVGKQDLDLDVSITMDLRLVDAKTHTVLFAESTTTLRREKASNLELALWSERNTVRIKQSSAGKQIRYAAWELVGSLSRFVDGLHQKN